MDNILKSGRRTKLFIAVAIVSTVLSIFQLLRIDIGPASKSLTSFRTSWGSVFLLFAVAMIAGVAYRISEWKHNHSAE
jgi:hypothetical protein